MHKNRVEITAGRVQAIREISSDSEVITTEAGAQPPHFFIDIITNNERHSVLNSAEYNLVKKTAELAAEKTGFEIVDLAGCSHAT